MATGATQLPTVSATLLLARVALEEMPWPSSHESALEAEGFGPDAEDYAASIAAAEGHDSADDLILVNNHGAADSNQTSRLSARDSSRHMRRRASINVLGSIVSSDIDAAAMVGRLSPGEGIGYTDNLAELDSADRMLTCPELGSATPARAHHLRRLLPDNREVVRTPAPHGCTYRSVSSLAGHVVPQRKNGALPSPFYGQRAPSMSNVTLGADSGSVFGERATHGVVGSCMNPSPTAALLLSFLVNHVSDKAPGVRARALCAIAAVLQRAHVTEVMETPWSEAHCSRAYAKLLASICSSKEIAASSGGSKASPEDDDLAVNTARNACSLPLLTEPSSIVGLSALVPILLHRMHEDRVAVKRGALNALVAVGLTPVGVPSNAASPELSVHGTAGLVQPTATLGVYALQALASLTGDKSLAIRRTALSALDDLLKGEGIFLYVAKFYRRREKQCTHITILPIPLPSLQLSRALIPFAPCGSPVFCRSYTTRRAA